MKDMAFQKNSTPCNDVIVIHSQAIRVNICNTALKYTQDFLKIVFSKAISAETSKNRKNIINANKYLHAKEIACANARKPNNVENIHANLCKKFVVCDNLSAKNLRPKTLFVSFIQFRARMKKLKMF